MIAPTSIIMRIIKTPNWITKSYPITSIIIPIPIEIIVIMWVITEC
jgi:hypothetical protein